MSRLLTRLFQASPAEAEHESKKPRRSERLSYRQDPLDPDATPVSTKQQLPSPVTHLTAEETSELFKEATATPPGGRPSQVPHGTDESQGLSSPPQDTQAAASQYIDPNAALCDEVEDEVKEGVWGYLFPLYTRYGGRCVVLKKRAACPLSDAAADAVPESAKATGKRKLQVEEDKLDSTAAAGLHSGGYLIGRHPECGM